MLLTQLRQITWLRPMSHLQCCPATFSRNFITRRSNGMQLWISRTAAYVVRTCKINEYLYSRIKYGRRVNNTNTIKTTQLQINAAIYVSCSIYFILLHMCGRLQSHKQQLAMMIGQFLFNWQRCSVRDKHSDSCILHDKSHTTSNYSLPTFSHFTLIHVRTHSKLDYKLWT